MTPRKGKNGGELKRGNPGNKGGIGAVPFDIKVRCWDELRSERLWQTIRMVTADPDSRNLGVVLKFLGDYGPGKPKQDVDVAVSSKIVHVFKLPPLGAKIIPDAEAKEVLPAPMAPSLAHPGLTALPSEVLQTTDNEDTDNDPEGPRG